MLKVSTHRTSATKRRVLISWAMLVGAAGITVATAGMVDAVRPTVHAPGSIVNFGGTTPAVGDDYVSTSPGIGGAGLALRSNGSIVGWGSNSNNLVAGIPAGNDFTAIATGTYHASALRADGSIVTWGNPSNIANLLSNSPTGTGFVKIAASEFIGLALRADGSIVRWGDNTIAAVPAGDDFVDIAAGNGYAIALRSDGTIEGWGFAPSGTPTETGFTDIAAGFEGCAMALRADGSIATWGASMGGFKFYAPTEAGFVDIAVGRNCMAAALKADGTIVRWAGTFGPAAAVPGAGPGSGIVDIAVDSAGVYALIPSAAPADTTAPTADVTIPADGATVAQGSVVTVAYSCADNVAVATCVGDLPNGAALPTSTAGTFTFAVTATDTSGLHTTVTHTYSVVDVTDPSIILGTPAEGAAYHLGQVVPAAYSCADNSAVLTCVGDVASGQAIDTSSPGTFDFQVVATDVGTNQTIETNTYSVDGTFASGLGLTGSITSIPAGYVVSIVDAVDPSDGVTVTVAGSGTAKVTLNVCGGFVVRIAPGSVVTLTCGSIEAVVITGSVELVDPNGTSTVLVLAGGAATLESNGNVTNDGPTPISVTAVGVTQAVAPGATVAWRASGFYQPVDMNGVWNSMKGGSTVPLKFEMFFGATELTNPAQVVLTVTRVQCTNGSEDSVEQLVTSGDTGVKYSNGQFQVNWKSPSIAGACYRVTAQDGGSSLSAYFKLK